MSKENTEVPNIATIMFVDIVGCSTISNVLGIKNYGEFLEEFKQIAEKRIKAILLDNYRTVNYERRKEIPEYLTYNVRGDEACVILFSDYDCSEDDKDSARTRDANTAIEIAIQIKQDWLACHHNQKQLKDGKLPCDLGIGINSGPVDIKKDDKGKLLPEGYAINLAKRIEGESRRGKYSGIIVGPLTKRLYDNDVGESEAFFDEVEMVNLKGILQPIPTYEINYWTLPTNLESISRRSPLLTETIEENIVRAKRLLPYTLDAWDANRSSAWLANVYGNQCFLSEEYEKAERAFLELRKAHPKDPEPHCLLGNVYGEQGEYIDEKECYKKAIKLNPYVPEWHYYLGLCLSYILKGKKSKPIVGNLNKEIDKILDCFDEAIYLSPQFSWAYYDKACILNYYGRKDQAQEELDKAMEIDPECKVAAESETYLEGLKGGPPIK
ncbi:MAG: hypothetical protein FVQ80_12620 [Planctomycetes bacterium]|nr:hypothetical protein [Planctomycetota bacterium]